MRIETAYRGSKYGALHSEHYAIYATTDLSVAARYGKVYELDLTALDICSIDDLGALLAEDFPQYADLDPETVDIDADPLFGSGSECYQIADMLDIDGVIDHKGNIEIWRGIDIVVK